MTAPVPPVAARDALWAWFAAREWEDIDLGAVTDECIEQVDLGVRVALGGFCLILGHDNDGYGSCVYCQEVLS